MAKNDAVTDGMLEGQPHVDITHEQMEGGIANDAALKDTAIYTGAHLTKIRELYAAGAPISLPAQISDVERAELDAKRAAVLSAGSAQTSTTAAASAKLPNTKVGSTAAQSSSSVTSSNTSSTPAGTAANPPSAQ